MNVIPATEYAEEIRNRLGRHVRQVVLFGSQARGDAGDGSDYDFLVVVDQRTREAREAVLDAGVAMMNRYDRLFASLLYSDEEWRSIQRYPLGWNILKEGVAV
ncbi:MAG: nucleotidyltransferase domain-containing protein [bacterium]